MRTEVVAVEHDRRGAGAAPVAVDAAAAIEDQQVHQVRIGELPITQQPVDGGLPLWRPGSPRCFHRLQLQADGVQAAFYRQRGLAGGEQSVFMRLFEQLPPVQHSHTARTARPAAATDRAGPGRRRNGGENASEASWWGGGGWLLLRQRTGGRQLRLRADPERYPFYRPYRHRPDGAVFSPSEVGGGTKSRRRGRGESVSRVSAACREGLTGNAR